MIEKPEISKTQLVDNLFWALWYNGLDYEVEYLAGLLEDAQGWLERSDPRMRDAGESMVLLWMILVQSFGDYRTSPRSGWVEDTRGAAEFLRSRIKRTWGEADG
ncbi:MAG: hypothetical protein IJ092_06375 [Atopobiaceae bacterium]|nr:hypothetical protein [Atopobiaceae bacterium]